MPVKKRGTAQHRENKNPPNIFLAKDVAHNMSQHPLQEPYPRHTSKWLKTLVKGRGTA